MKQIFDYFNENREYCRKLITENKSHNIKTTLGHRSSHWDMLVIFWSLLALNIPSILGCLHFSNWCTSVMIYFDISLQMFPAQSPIFLQYTIHFYNISFHIGLRTNNSIVKLIFIQYYCIIIGNISDECSTGAILFHNIANIFNIVLL